VRERSDWSSIIFGLVLASVAAFQQFKLPPVLPAMLEGYGYDRVLAGGFMSVYAVVGLLLSLPLSRVLARGRVLTTVWAGLGAFLFGNLLVLAWPQSGWAVLSGRALEGIGFTVLALVGPACANANAARASLPLVAALSATWIPAGQTAAALIALPTQDEGLWRPVWWAAIALTLMLAVYLVVLMRRRGLFLGVAAKPGGRGAIVGGEERVLLYGAGAAFFFFSCQYFAFMTWFPDHVVQTLDLTPAEATHVYLIPVVMVGVFNLLSASLLKRGVPPGHLLVAGFLFEAVCWWLLPEIGPNVWGLILLVGYGIGAGLIPTGLFAMPSAVLGQGGPTVAAFGILMTMRNLGVLAGPLLLPLSIGPDGGWHSAAPVMSAMSAAAILLCFWLGIGLTRRQERQP